MRAHVCRVSHRACEPFVDSMGNVLGQRYSLILGLAVLALATVDAEKTGASAQTADFVNPNF